MILTILEAAAAGRVDVMLQDAAYATCTRELTDLGYLDFDRCLTPRSVETLTLLRQHAGDAN